MPFYEIAISQTTFWAGQNIGRCLFQNGRYGERLIVMSERQRPGMRGGLSEAGPSLQASGGQVSHETV